MVKIPLNVSKKVEKVPAIIPLSPLYIFVNIYLSGFLHTPSIHKKVKRHGSCSSEHICISFLIIYPREVLLLFGKFIETQEE